MIYARINNSVVQEVIDFDPAGRFTDEIAKLFVVVPDGTGVMDTDNGDGTFTKYIAPIAPPVIIPSTPIIRRLSKLGFVGRLGTDFASILTAAKASVEIEMFVRMLDWATPDADGTSVDLDDPRVIGALQALELAGVIGVGRAAEILA